jgi:hypothetical protein
MVLHGDGIWREDFVEQFPVEKARSLWTFNSTEKTPKILVAILVKQSELFLLLI